ncbi:MAG: Lon protease family protein [Alphaproteobacteria bacterium]
MPKNSKTKKKTAAVAPAAGKATPLPPDALRRRTDPAGLGFKTTVEVEPLSEALGQERALEAIRFGIGMVQDGYNMFALGPDGIGKHRMVRQFLERQAATEPVPADWCYVHNFENPHKPQAVSLPPGRARPFRADMDHLIDELRAALPAAFEADEYRVQRQAVESRMKQLHEGAFEEFQEKAKAKGAALIRTPAGLALAPMKGEEVMDPEEFQKLPTEQKQAIQKTIEALQGELQEVMQKLPLWEREARAQMRELNRRTAQFAITHLMDEVEKRYADVHEVAEHLRAVEKDMIDNAEDFLKPEQPSVPMPGGATPDQHPATASPFSRYKVNVLIDNADRTGAPVLYEDHPNHPNLFGKIEYRPLFGALVTDFSMILPGALHRANGGYLIVDARKVLMQPYGWEELKHALRSREIRIEPLGYAFGAVSTTMLEPEPIPLNIKVVLLGDRQLYYMLASADPEFGELFKVPVDFEEYVEREPKNGNLYARFLASLIDGDKLRPFTATAIAKVMDRAARLVEDSERLSMQLRQVGGLLREADYWAGQRKAELVDAQDVDKAIAAQIRRSDRMRERMEEQTVRGIVHIDTSGEVIGQLNGLSVLSLGDYSFGKPSRITASVGLGKGEVVDIEREVALGGPLHSKGVLILQGFLAARYGAQQPLSLKASLVFEQSYGGVDGDSASSAELYTLLSALAEVPIRQSFAVTGSVDQHGHVQAIGGVNEKIEGFFDLCRVRGLTGEQGVMIPATNVTHLMLREDIVAAAKAGKFRVFPIETIDQGIEVLTGTPAGKRGKNGRYPANSINGRVQARLDGFAAAARRFSHKGRAS